MKDDDKLAMCINLPMESCGLKHENEKKAINYLCQEFKGGETLTIPICEECERKSVDNDWVLLYCTNCHANHWIFKPASSRQYHYKKGEKVKWLPECPYCWKGGE